MDTLAEHVSGLRRARLLSGCGALAVAAALLGASPSAAAKPSPISGKLSKPGYTVIALSAGGKANTALAARGSFSLRPPASRVTLQLRAPNGVYAGPVVISSAQKGKRAIVGVRAGARLGTITIHNGYARASKLPPSKWIDTTRWARAATAVPIGAKNFGLKRSKPPKVGPIGDLDADGVPDKLDVDINGNLIMNTVDRATASGARAAQTGSTFFVGVNLPVPLADNMNANASAITDAQIDRTLSQWQFIGIGILPGNPELDCGGSPDPANPQGWIGGLSYCRRGGTGATRVPGTSGLTDSPFPACCDADADGYGELVNGSANIPGFAPTFSLIPRAPSSQIGTGDLLIQRVTSNGVTTDTPTMLPFVFATVPAIVAYDDGQGHSVTLDYPLPPNAGTMDNEFPVAAGPTGDVVLKLTFWRPQRRPIPPEPGDWTDIGKLRYVARVQSVSGSSGSAGNCPQSSFSEDDPNLTPNAPTDGAGLTDTAPDQPANPANTLTYTLNLTNCLAASGATWNPGATALIHFSALSGSGGSVSETGTWAMFKRQ